MREQPPSAARPSGRSLVAGSATARGSGMDSEREARKAETLPSNVSTTEYLLFLQHFVDYGLATLIGRDDLVDRGVSAKGNVDLVVAGIEQDVDW
jgi:hypothetical protein